MTKFSLVQCTQCLILHWVSPCLAQIEEVSVLYSPRSRSHLCVMMVKEEFSFVSRLPPLWLFDLYPSQGAVSDDPWKLWYWKEKCLCTNVRQSTYLFNSSLGICLWAASLDSCFLALFVSALLLISIMWLCLLLSLLATWRLWFPLSVYCLWLCEVTRLVRPVLSADIQLANTGWEDLRQPSQAGISLCFPSYPPAMAAVILCTSLLLVLSWANMLVGTRAVYKHTVG